MKKHVSKNKVNLEIIKHEIERTDATNLDKGSLQVELDQMVIKGLIYNNYKSLNKDILRSAKETPSDKVLFTYNNGVEENHNSSLSFIAPEETHRN